MKITIDAVPVKTLNDIQKTLKDFINPIHPLGFLMHRTHGSYRKGIIKGISIAHDVIELYKKGEEKMEALIDRDNYCKDCKRSIYGEMKNCDVNIENNGYYPCNWECNCKVKAESEVKE